MASSSSPVSSSLKASLSAAASAAAAIMVARSVAQDFLPDEFHDYLSFYIRKFLGQFSSQLTMVVNEFDDRLVPNQIYDAAETYLASRINPSTKRLNVSQPDKENTIQIRMESHEEVADEFEGVKFNWILRSKKIQSPPRRRLGSSRRDDDDDLLMLSHAKFFEVSFPKQHQEMAVKSYFPHIVREARAMKQEKRTLKIFTVEPDNLYGDISEVWTGVNLDHPATFDTLALDTELKNNILTDLERFVKRKDYYKRVGKAWKRGYLLYGPPGTGKSSLIAAMANYLNFDVYDLELTELRENSELRKLIIATANQSILVVEDIDCTVDFQDRSSAAGAAENSNSSQRRHVTLSGLLNFIDGLWSSCGDERIIVFTTNHKEKLDSALLRPGRMDMHINLSYCTPCGFRILAGNYLGVKDHELFDEIEGLVSEAEVTPAEVAEQLMRNDDDGDSGGVLARLIEFLKLKKDEEKGEVERKSGEMQEIGDSGSSSGSDDED
ncbi:unnamed protein product [Linum tenue]|uniref:AAA+ ATPase domain-containing protein n=1 Tax=Linum tenue TaxID=586396 RepID=A0AAV0IPS0_9ROSI|nr:unnamed protein product [Linum tenue]